MVVVEAAEGAPHSREAAVPGDAVEAAEVQAGAEVVVVVVEEVSVKALS